MENQSKQEQQEIQEFIQLLRAHPHGLTCKQIKSKLAISDSTLYQLLYKSAAYPIGHDGRLDNKYYWAGR